MANISDASGILCISDCSIENGKKILNIFENYQSRFNYYTDYEYISDNDEQVTADFDGLGRWSYYSNLEYMGEWINYVLSEKDKKILQNIDFRLTYSYTDIELNTQLFEKRTVELFHKKGRGIKELPIISNSVEELKISVWNLVQVFKWSINDTLKYLYSDDIEDISEDWEYWEEDIEGIINDTVSEYSANLNLNNSDAKKYLCDNSSIFKEYCRLYALKEGVSDE